MKSVENLSPPSETPRRRSVTRTSSKGTSGSRAKTKAKPRTRAPEPVYNDQEIVVKGARAHNLRDIDVTLPRDQLVVITGPSGSGKSSLAFDTIYAEGQRRYVESLSAYARQFLEQMAKPEVESITGLSPTISIEQRTTSYNPRSTVGTVTEVYDYLRLLFARVATPFCYKCGGKIESQSPQQITDQIVAMDEQSKIAILAPIVRGRKGEYQRELVQLRQQGFVRVQIDGEIHDLSEEIKLDKNKRHDINVYVDRIVIKGDRGNLGARVAESVELALKLGGGLLLLENLSGKKKKLDLLSEKFACNKCNVSYPEPEPRTFSFNSPMGACPRCEGLGVEPDSEEDEAVYQTSDGDIVVDQEEAPCKQCQGARLRKESLHYRIGEKNISELCDLAISDVGPAIDQFKLSDREHFIADRILKEIKERLDFLNRVGVSYLSLSRSAKTLSGGESQRIRLATQIGSSLVGVIYVLDEPSIGLHPRDHSRLLNTLVRLRDMGNTVLVVEHDRDTIDRADWIVDLGPGAGMRGGEVVAAGSLPTIKKNKKSLTGQYLTGSQSIPVPKRRRRPEKGEIRVSGASIHNLKEVDVSFPLGTFICVTGVSGSGKSSLVIDTLYPYLLEAIYDIDLELPPIREIQGRDLIDKVIDIDQSPIGKTPRSNPATYTGLFSLIRDLFAQLPESQVRGFKKGRFSFNVKGGRCEACEGAGVVKIEMHFLPNVYVKCDTCRGRRYNRDTLDIRYKGKNISEVLAMTAEEALEFFEAIPPIKQKLRILNDVGLGYITLGQRATTLSGGEAQRIKLSKELSRKSTGKTFYILDEPSTGLHFDDVKKLLNILQMLVDQGNTVVVIEHNSDIIKVADHLIDLGPEGGAGGGMIVARGTPEEIARNPKSYTGAHLKGLLG